MADYVKCDKCGNDEFIRVLAIPKGQGTKPCTEERKLICAKCDDELTADEVNNALREA